MSVGRPSQVRQRIWNHVDTRERCGASAQRFCKGPDSSTTSLANSRSLHSRYSNSKRQRCRFQIGVPRLSVPVEPEPREVLVGHYQNWVYMKPQNWKQVSIGHGRSRSGVSNGDPDVFDICSMFAIAPVSDSTWFEPRDVDGGERARSRELPQILFDVAGKATWLAVGETAKMLMWRPQRTLSKSRCLYMWVGHSTVILDAVCMEVEYDGRTLQTILGNIRDNCGKLKIFGG